MKCLIFREFAADFDSRMALIRHAFVAWMATENCDLELMP